MSTRTPVALPPRLSPSSITTWKQCPLLWKLRYVDKAPEPTSTALARGIAAHEALEKIFDEPPLERDEAKLHDLFRAAWSALRKEPRYEELFAGDRKAERAWGLESLDTLSAYFELEDPATLVSNPRARELRLAATLSAGGDDDCVCEVVGVVDRLDVTPTGLRIVDYKTGAAPNVAKYAPATQARILDEKFFQLRIYAMLLARSRGELPRSLKLFYLGSCDAVVAPCDEAAVERTEVEVLDVFREMSGAAAEGCFNPKTGPLCGWCHFKESCPAFA